MQPVDTQRGSGLRGALRLGSGPVGAGEWLCEGALWLTWQNLGALRCRGYWPGALYKECRVSAESLDFW